MSTIASEPKLVDTQSLREQQTSAETSAARSQSRFEQIINIAEVVGDFSAATIGLILTYYFYHLLGLGRGVVYPLRTVLDASLAFALVFVLMLHHDGAYCHGLGLLRIRETERTLRVSAQAFLLLFPVFVLAAHLVSRWVLGIGFILVPAVALIQKHCFIDFVSYLYTRDPSRRKATIIYGAGFTGKRMLSALARSPKLGLDPIVVVDDDETVAGKELYSFGYRRERSAPVIAGPMTAELIRGYGAKLVVVAIPSLGSEKLSAVAAAAAGAGASLAYVPSAAISSDEWVDQMDIDGLLLMSVSTPKSRSFYEIAKRIFDFLVAVTLLAFFAPLFALIALAVIVDSKGPVIFKQSRVGKDGGLFEIYKFRSMQVNAPRYEFSPKKSEDPRITTVGRFLRKVSLDELPQLWNVVKGDMSLVGPRPEMPFIVVQYGSRERQRLCVTPGITGLWQLSADRAFLIHENLQYDLYYIRHRGFFMDLAILLHTALFAVKGV
jgi:exopolysaccharide biosynthesis polyprenyl glycosylphosphotransferase